MKIIHRLKNRSISRLANRFPAVANHMIASHKPIEFADVPWTAVTKPLVESKIAIVTTAGLHHTHQIPFDMHDPMGDPTYRIIDAQTIEDDYVITHDYYDHRDADKDLNVVFPVTRLKEMAESGMIGAIARRHYSFMGHILDLNLDKLIEASAPEVAAAIKQDKVDAVILTPGWGICNQSVGLIQREIERQGVPTVGISLVRSYTEKVRPPRSIHLDQALGHALGEPFNVKQQLNVLDHAFEALYSISTPGEISDLTL